MIIRALKDWNKVSVFHCKKAADANMLMQTYKIISYSKVSYSHFEPDREYEMDQVKC